MNATGNKDPSLVNGQATQISSTSTSTYKSILSMTSTKPKSTVVGLNPNMKPTTDQSYAKIFPMYGLWSE